MRWPLLALALLLLGTCSAIDSRFLLRGYDVKAGDAVKRIAVAAWAPAAHADVAPLAAHIGTDLVKLHKNYLVHDPVAVKRDWDEACGELQGVLSLRLLEVAVQDNKVDALMTAELHRCSDGELLWRTLGRMKVASDDASLTNLADVYVRESGPAAKQFAAPIFALVKELVDDMPNPILTDEEVNEKIELGAAPRRSAVIADVPARGSGQCNLREDDSLPMTKILPAAPCSTPRP